MAKRRADYGVVLFFAYPVHARLSSEVSHGVGVGAQVFSFHFHTAVFHPSVFCISAFVLMACRRRLSSEESSITSASVKKEGTSAAGYVNYA